MAGRDDLDLDWDPPREILAALGELTGPQMHELLPMTIAGWVPWLMDSLDPGTGLEMLGTYVRQHAVLLRPRRGKGKTRSPGGCPGCRRSRLGRPARRAQSIRSAEAC